MSQKSFARNIKRHGKNLVGNQILEIVKQEILLMIIFKGAIFQKKLQVKKIMCCV
jgi:hypothetical protein